MAAVSLLSLAAAGDWAVITGASTGIGRQLALEAAREGYNVVLTARRAPLLQKLAAEIEAEHAVATRVCAGCLTDAKFVERLRDAAPGSVSLLVANAGCGMEGDAVAAHRRVKCVCHCDVRVCRASPGHPQSICLVGVLSYAYLVIGKPPIKHGEYFCTVANRRRAGVYRIGNGHCPQTYSRRVSYERGSCPA